MSRKGRTIVMAAAIMMLAAGTLLAQGPEGFGGGQGGPMMHSEGAPMQGMGMEYLMRMRMLFGQLDLTEEQQTEIRTIVETAREEVQAIIEAARPQEETESFLDIFTSPTLTVRDLEDGIGRMDEVRDQVRDIVFQAIVDVHDVLTVEQLEKLAELAEERNFGMDGHGHGMGRDPGMRPDRW
jgi:Spy/CpxP family protein refolding chaperone